MASSAHGQIITTVAGTSGGTIYDPQQIVFDNNGNLYFPEALGNRVLKIDTSGIITTIAGTGIAGFYGDGGPATLAKLKQPSGIAIDTLGNIFITDNGNNRIRKISATSGIINTISGNDTAGYSGDGDIAASAKLWLPNGLLFDNIGNLYIADNGNYRIRKIGVGGTITTIAGSGVSGSSGDGFPATDAMCGPSGNMCIDVLGNIYFIDGVNHTIRKINTSGIITTVGGNGLGGYSGDEIPATSASMVPQGFVLDDSGSIFIADWVNNRIRKIDQTGIIHTISGNGTGGSIGDGGDALTAEVNYPCGIIFDRCGNLFFGQVNQPRIRKITFNTPDTSTIFLSGVTSASLGSTVAISATVGGVSTGYTIIWYDNGIPFDTTTGLSTSYTKTLSTDTITARVLPAGECNISSVSAAHIVTDASTIIDNVSKQGNFSIYPIPAHDAIVINATQSICNFSITNMIGQVLYSSSCANTKADVDISWLPSGIYLIKVKDSHVQKMIKQ